MTRTCPYCSRPLPPRHKMLACNLCSDMDRQAAFTPTPEQIAEQLAAIQAGWTAADYAKRSGKVESNLTVADAGFDRRRNGANFCE